MEQKEKLLKKMIILLTDCATLSYKNDLSLKPIERLGDIRKFEGITQEELLKQKDTEILLCNKTIINRKVIESMPNLKYIGLFATGYNNIDIEAANEYGITVCNAGSYSTNAVAQQVFAYILSHYNKVELYGRYVAQGNWITSPTFSMLCFPTEELDGKTIGIIGYGSIGKRVSEIAKAFGMKIKVFTRTPKENNDVIFTEFDNLLSTSDIVTVHCPLNNSSSKMFNAKAFKLMKNGSFFINTSRGGVVDEKALFDALVSEKLSGAAIDVLENEPMKSDCILRNAPNIIITPHTSWAPLDTRKRLVSIVADNIESFVSGTPKNVVNN